MATNNQDSLPTTGKVFVLHSVKSNVSKADLKKLLLDTGQDEKQLAFIDPEDDTLDLEFSQDDKLIIPLEPVMNDDEAVEKVILAAARAVCAIIGVWPKGATEQTIHSAVAKFGIAQIPWDPGRMQDAIGSDCPQPYETPDGGQSKPHSIKRNKC